MTLTGVACDPQAPTCFGAARLLGGSFELVDLLVTGNEATGAAVVAFGVGLTVRNVRIIDNIGGALTADGTIDIEGLWLENNRAEPGFAGTGLTALRLYDSPSLVARNVFMASTPTRTAINIGSTESFLLENIWTVGHATSEVSVVVYDSDGTIDGWVALSSSSIEAPGWNTVGPAAEFNGSEVTIRNAALGGFTDRVVGVFEVEDSWVWVHDSVIFGNQGSTASVGAALGGGGLLFEQSAFFDNAEPDYAGVTDPLGTNFNMVGDPGYASSTSVSGPWTMRLASDSPLVDAGFSTDPDGSPLDIGPMGGPTASTWDLDRDGFPAAWAPGPYTEKDRAAGLDCDDFNANRTPLDGC